MKNLLIVLGLLPTATFVQAQHTVQVQLKEVEASRGLAFVDLYNRSPTFSNPDLFSAESKSG